MRLNYQQWKRPDSINSCIERIQLFGGRVSNRELEIFDNHHSKTLYAIAGERWRGVNLQTLSNERYTRYWIVGQQPTGDDPKQVEKEAGHNAIEEKGREEREEAIDRAILEFCCRSLN